MRWAIVLIALAWSTSTIASTPTINAATAAQIDQLFANFDRTDTPGYVVGVVRDNQLVLSRSYGRANLDHNIALSPRTSFHLASLSKQFTAAAVALLIRDRRLSLEDPVTRWLPAFEKFGSDLRVKHLVYMTSGLPEYSDLPRAGGIPWQSFSYFDTEDMLKSVLSASQLTHAPGQHWRYTNTNYLVLARIVEAASGQKLADFLQQRVFTPLQMNQAHLNDDSTLVVTGRATGYIGRSEALVAEGRSIGLSFRGGTGWARLERVSPHYGGSGVFASLEDLVKWDTNWYSEGVGGRGFTELMHSRQRFAHAKDNDAFGLVRSERFGHEMWSYAGGDLDSSTYMARFPKLRTTVICLSNISGGGAEERCRSMLDLLNAAGLMRAR